MSTEQRPPWESPEYLYGQRASFHGNRQKSMRCVKAVREPPHYIIEYQCSRQNGHGHNGLYCKQHAGKYP